MHFSSKNAFFTIFVTISFFTKFLEDLHLRRDFCQTVNSTEHLSVAIAVFCVPCELQTPNLAVFFPDLHLSTSYDKNKFVFCKLDI